MPYVDRFSVSLDTELLAAFDRHIADRGYENRSEAIRDMIRDLLVTTRLQHGNAPAVAILVVVCDHRQTEAPKRLRACLASNVDVVLGSLQIPIDEHRDVWAIGLKGSADRVQAVGNEIRSGRGVAYGHLLTIPVCE